VIDIHSHILPGWDDGAPTLDDSLAMLKMAAETGTTDIVATPHANSEFHFDAEVVIQKFEELKKAAGGLIRLHLGCDFHIQIDNVQDALANPTKYTINHGPYLMAELPEMMQLPVMRIILGRLREVGIVPIITHPERNTQLQNVPDELKGWVEDGCLLQITGQSFLGGFGPRAKQMAVNLMRDNLVHVVSSDGHDTVHRPPRLDVAYDWVKTRYGTERAERLFSINPGAALTGAPIDAFAYEEAPGPGKKWYEFWR
jgi:protein-tyrosine phosphatase